MKIKAILASFVFAASAFAALAGNPQTSVSAWQAEGLLLSSGAGEQYYSASRWIWGAAEAHSHETYSFRAEFNVPGQVRRASIKVYVDDGALYWMNGTSYSRNAITDGSGVQEGRNVLAMLATNHVSKAGIILRGDIELTDGSHVIVNSMPRPSR